MTHRDVTPSNNKRRLLKDYPKEQQEDIRRQRNAESARRFRLKKKTQEQVMQRRLDEYDRRIANLEHTVQMLSSKLGHPDRQNPANARSPSSPDNIPHWFGAPF